MFNRRDFLLHARNAMALAASLSVVPQFTGCGDGSSESENDPLATLDSNDPSPAKVKVPPAPDKPNEVSAHRTVMTNVVKSVRTSRHFKHLEDGTIKITEEARNELHPSIHTWVTKTIEHLNASHRKRQITIHPDYRITIHDRAFLPPHHARNLKMLTLRFEDQLEATVPDRSLLKRGGQTVERSLTCNLNSWVAHWWGWEFFIDTDKAELIAETGELISEAADVLEEIPVVGPILMVVVKLYFGIYAGVIKGENDACGIILNQSWFEYLAAIWYPPAALLLWVTKQD